MPEDNSKAAEAFERVMERNDPDADVWTITEQELSSFRNMRRDIYVGGMSLDAVEVTRICGHEIAIIEGRNI